MRLEAARTFSLRFQRVGLGVLGTTVVCLLGAVLAGGQTAPAEKPLLSEEAFKNVQVLKGIPVSQFMESMGFFCASLGQSCEYCHTSEKGNWEDYAAETPHKETARKMLLMMEGINKANFNGRRVVTCYSCHNGGDRPKITPTIAGVYSAPVLEDPNEMPLGQAPAATSADQILDKYIAAVGGAGRLASLTGFVANGTSEGYGDEAYERPLEIFAKPGQRTTIIHMLSGDNTTAYDGRTAWVAAPATAAPVPVISLTGTDLDGVKMDADLSFPARIKQALTGWRAGAPAMIDDREVQVLQGTTAGRNPVRLFFDKESGLLVRQVRYTESPVGLNPTQIDYADYREVGGVKMPFRWVVSWLDGMATFTLSDVQANASIDAKRFAKPAPPAPPAKAAKP